MNLCYTDTVSGGLAAAMYCRHTSKPINLYISDPRQDYNFEFEQVVFMDFCPGRKALKKLLDNGCGITIYDYHSATPGKCNGLPVQCYHDMGKCGARLYLESIDITKHHWTVDYVEDILFYREELPSSKAIDAFFRFERYCHPDFWENIMAKNLGHVMIDSIPYYNTEQSILNRIIRERLKTKFDGYDCLTVNSSYRPWTLAQRLAQDATIGSCWYATKEGAVNYLYTLDPSINLAVLANRHGGGGTRNRATIRMKRDG